VGGDRPGPGDDRLDAFGNALGRRDFFVMVFDGSACETRVGERMHPRVWRALLAISFRVVIGSGLPAGVLGSLEIWLAVAVIAALLPAPRSSAARRGPR
jgi:hypothetical protein